MTQHLEKSFVDQVEIPFQAPGMVSHAEANVADMRFGSTAILPGKVLFERQKFEEDWIENHVLQV